MALVQTPPIFSELLDFLAYKPSEELQSRLSYLLDKNRNLRLTDDENAELDEILRIGHFVNMLKIRVRKKMMALPALS